MVEEFSEKIFTRVLKECLAPSNEQILLIGDYGRPGHELSKTLSEGYAAACQQMGLSYDLIFQQAKNRGEPADTAVIQKLKDLPKGSVVLINVSDRMGGLEALGKHSLREYLKKRQHRFTSASTLGSIPTSMSASVLSALDVDYKKAHDKSLKIKKALDNGHEAHLTSKKGTDLVFGIDGMTGRAATGVYHQAGTGGNLPGSEAYIAPNKKKVNGTVVIDGSSRVRKGTTLIQSEQGIRLRIKNGSITAMNTSPEATILHETLQWAYKQSNYPWGVRRIGELGIGTNHQAKIIGSTIIDEKVAGSAHIAIGSNQWFGGSIYSIIHLDQVIRDAKVKIDGRTVRP